MQTIHVDFGTIYAFAVKTLSGRAETGRSPTFEKAVRGIAQTAATKTRSVFKTVATCVLSASLLTHSPGLLATQAHGSPDMGYDESPLIVLNDYGGLLRERLLQIAELRAQRRPIEIRGRVCYSTCTMLLGLPNACVSPRTMFGFHGPSSYGRSLDKTTFDRASAVIASYYPEPLQEWYMTDARFTINGVRRVRGDNIIEMGIASC